MASRRPRWGHADLLVSNQAVFFLTAILAAPAILALGRIRMSEVERPKHMNDETAPASLRSALCDRRLLVFAGCILLFQLANAAMLPIMGSILTMRSSAWASTLIGACIVVPTVIVAGVAPWVGRHADSWGRRPLLLLCFAALALRATLFALVSSPYLIVAVQLLDGVCAAVLGVVLPLVVADVMRGTGRFNLGLGVVGSAVGIGAALSTTFAGYIWIISAAVSRFEVWPPWLCAASAWFGCCSRRPVQIRHWIRPGELAASSRLTATELGGALLHRKRSSSPRLFEPSTRRQSRFNSLSGAAARPVESARCCGAKIASGQKCTRDAKRC